VKRLIRGHQSLADKEIRILLKLENHENVVRYYGSAENEDFVYLAIERCWVKTIGQPSTLFIKLLRSVI